MIKLLLVDDDLLIREAIKGLLIIHQEFDVLGSLSSGEEALSFLENNPIDIILLDLNMPGLGGFESTKKIHHKYPKVKIIIITVNKSESLPRHLLKAGASAYLTKGCEVEELMLAIKRVYAGKNYISRELSQQIAINILQYDKSPFELLGAREMQVIIMILQGMKSLEIAEQLNLSPKTISTHKSRAMEKLNIETDIELVHLAIQYNIIDPA
ncbi:MAG: response regulator [Pseudomonadota bacterium]